MSTRNVQNVKLALDALEARDTPSAAMLDGAGHFKAEGGAQTTVVFSASNTSERETFSDHPGQVFLVDHARRSGPRVNQGGDTGSPPVEKTLPPTDRGSRVQDVREGDTSRSPSRQRDGLRGSHAAFIPVPRSTTFGDFGSRGMPDLGLDTDATSSLKKGDPIWAV